jgi:hypothetical protein
MSVAVAVAFSEPHLLVLMFHSKCFKNKPINSKNSTFVHTGVPQVITKLEMKEEVTN